MSSLIDNTVTDDGVAPYSARTPAGTVMTKFVSCLFMWPALGAIEHD